MRGLLKVFLEKAIEDEKTNTWLKSNHKYDEYLTYTLREASIKIFFNENTVLGNMKWTIMLMCNTDLVLFINGSSKRKMLEEAVLHINNYIDDLIKYVEQL